MNNSSTQVVQKKSEQDVENQSVSDYFNKQTPERKKVLHTLREIIFQTLPHTKEDFLWGVPVYADGKIYLASLKNQVNMGFSIIGLNDAETKLFEGNGKTTRHIKVSNLQSINKQHITYLIQLINKKARPPQ